MAKGTFICSADALRAYGKEDIRTLKSWAKKGYILYQVIGEKSTRPQWLFESPEARYNRVMGLV